MTLPGPSPLGASRFDALQTGTLRAGSASVARSGDRPAVGPRWSGRDRGDRDALCRERRPGVMRCRISALVREPPSSPSHDRRPGILRRNSRAPIVMTRAVPTALVWVAPRSPMAGRPAENRDVRRKGRWPWTDGRCEAPEVRWQLSTRRCGREKRGRPWRAAEVCSRATAEGKLRVSAGAHRSKFHRRGPLLSTRRSPGRQWQLPRRRATKSAPGEFSVSPQRERRKTRRGPAPEEFERRSGASQAAGPSPCLSGATVVRRPALGHPGRGTFRAQGRRLEARCAHGAPLPSAVLQPCRHAHRPGRGEEL